jgi:hypothetical protein
MVEHGHDPFPEPFEIPVTKTDSAQCLEVVVRSFNHTVGVCLASHRIPLEGIDNFLFPVDECLPDFYEFFRLRRVHCPDPAIDECDRAFGRNLFECFKERVLEACGLFHVRMDV